MPQKKSEPKFEKDLAKLEEIVDALEEGELARDDSLKRFEEGIQIARRCEKTLAQAEKRIESLTKNAEGELEAEPFDADEEPKCQPKTADDADEGSDEDGEGLLF